MRAPIFILVAFVGCNWADFDDLADTTWVRSTQKPSIGSRNYATAILGVTVNPTGGQLGVISDDTPDFSTLDYAADGTEHVGPNDVKLGAHSIAVLSDPPIFVTDDNGKIAMVERSTMPGMISVVFGSATAPVGRQFAAAAGLPDAAVFSGTDVVIAAGNTLYTVQSQPTPLECAGVDNASMPLAVAALATETTNLWVWTKNGALFSYPIASLAAAPPCSLPVPGNAFSITSFMPGSGARIHIVGNYAILTAHDGSSRRGQVYVVELATLAAVGAPLAVDGLNSSAIAVIGGTIYVVLGVPDQAVEGVVAGQVELHEFNPATGMLTATPALVLADAQPESGGLFGRSVTAMKFNDQTILVVGANSEVYAYYRTALYDALP